MFSFFEHFDVWGNAVAVLVISGIALSFTGVWISLKKALFLPLVVSSFSSLGVVCTFFISELLSIDSYPYAVSLIFAVAVSFYFANQKHGGLKAQSFIYFLSFSLIFILGSFIRADIHDIDSILFGSAVLADLLDVFSVSGGAFILFSTFFISYRKFQFVSFDPESAKVSGINSYTANSLMYAVFAMMISISSRAAGAFPVFGLTILPALTGLNLGKSMKSVFIISAITGAVSAFSGYYISFVFELPTGASVVAVAGIIYGLSEIKKEK
jgi:zinc transport system permease protein